MQALASTQTHAGKCESESQETKQAHVPFVTLLEHTAHFVPSLPHGGIYDITVFKSNWKKKRKGILKRNNLLSPCLYTSELESELSLFH